MVAARRGARAAGARGAGARAAVATARAAAMAGVADAAVRLEEPWAASGAEAWVVVTAATAAALALAAVGGGRGLSDFSAIPAPHRGLARRERRLQLAHATQMVRVTGRRARHQRGWRG